MPRKRVPHAGSPATRSWTPDEISLLRRRFADTTNIDLASALKRTAKSIIFKASALGLTKSAAHRSAQSRKTALANAKTSEEMAAMGARGGKVGGKARAESLSASDRKRIARNAIKARWAARDLDK